jgi:GntR family transcriptional regulator
MTEIAMQASTTALPLYIQISELLTREIAAGRWVEGDRLPPESDLSATLGVAVGTLRKALAELDARGLLERRQGSGTYIKQNPSSTDNAKAKSIYEFFRLELLRGGGLPTATVIDFKKMPRPAFVPSFADRKVAAAKASHCYRVLRLRCLNSIPVAIEEIYFDARHHPKLKLEDLGEALYWFYQQRLGFWIAHTEDRIGMGTVPDWSPGLFSPAPGAYCPRVERISWSGKNQIEEYSITWFDTARCRYVNRLK